MERPIITQGYNGPSHVRDIRQMGNFCSRCGTALGRNDLFCPNCRMATNGGADYYGEAYGFNNYAQQPINPSMPATMPYSQQELYNILYVLQQFYDIVPKGQYQQPTTQYAAPPFAVLYNAPVMQPIPVSEDEDEEPEDEVEVKAPPKKKASKSKPKKAAPKADIETETEPENEAEEIEETPAPAATKTAKKKTEPKPKEEKAEESVVIQPIRLKSVEKALKEGRTVTVNTPSEQAQNRSPRPAPAPAPKPFREQVKPNPRFVAAPQPTYAQQRPAFGQGYSQHTPPPSPTPYQRGNRKPVPRTPAYNAPRAQGGNLPAKYTLRNEDGYYNDTVPMDGGYQRNGITRVQVIKIVAIAGGMILAFLVVFGVIPAVFG